MHFPHLMVCIFTLTADACLIFHDSTLYLIAGATAKYLYAHDPSKVTIPSQIIF